MRRGELPSEELGGGVLILLAGALLVTPGLITDGVGFLLLVPFVRRALLRYLTSRWRSRMTFQSFSSSANTFRTGHQHPSEKDVIDAEVIDVKVVDADVLDPKDD